MTNVSYQVCEGLGNASGPGGRGVGAGSVESYLQIRVAGMLWRVVAPCLLVLGTLGNALALLVLTRKTFRRSSMSMYLTILAVVDTLVLYTGLLRNIIIMASNFDFRYSTEALCRLHVFAVYVTLDTSVWILVLVTIERVLCVWRPQAIKVWVTRKQAVARSVCACALLMAINSHYLVGMGNVTETFGNITHVIRCTELWAEYRNFSQVIWPWIDLCIYFLVPSAIILTGNFSIIARVILSRQAIRRSSLPSISATAVASAATTSTNRRTSSMTVTLIVINFVFVLTTSPVSVLQVGARIWLTGTMATKEANYELAWAITNLIMYSNNAFNFLLYVLSGPRFRRELRCIFSRK